MTDSSTFMTGVLKKTGKLIVICFIGSLLFAAGFGVYLAFLSRDLPSLEQLEHYDPRLTTNILSADGKLIKELFTQRRIYIPLDELPEDLIRALLVTEDQRFFSHWGVNLARTGYAAFVNITPWQADQLRPVVDQIIPADETPSASEIGVVHFIDVALGGFMAGALPAMTEGLKDLQQRSQSAHPQIKDFADLSFEQQTRVLATIEDSEFFGTLHFLTLCGMFCMPKYGGNRDHAGWELLGFDHRHAWQPPFGHYDASVHGDVKTNDRG